jgi:hypothetical protein
MVHDIAKKFKAKLSILNFLFDYSDYYRNKKLHVMKLIVYALHLFICKSYPFSLIRIAALKMLAAVDIFSLMLCTSKRRGALVHR